MNIRRIEDVPHDTSSPFVLYFFENDMQKNRLIIVLLALLFTLVAAAQKRDLTLTMTVKAAGDDLKGQKVQLWQKEFDVSYGSLTLDSEGMLKVAVYEGTHLLRIERDGYEVVDTVFEVKKDLNITINLKEKTREPFALTTKVTHDVMSGNNQVMLSWNKEQDAFFDDFEEYEPFAIKFGAWTGIDADNVAAAPLVGTYANRGTLQYAQIMSPMNVDPMWWYDYPVLRPYSGGQYVGFTRTGVGTANDDWLISPVITLGSDHLLSFMAKAADKYTEKFQVYITTKTDQPKQADFTLLSKDNYETATVQGWRKYTYDLSSYKGQQVKVAIRYVSESNNGGAFMLMVDDVKVEQVYKENPNEKFVITLDDKEVATTYERELLVPNVGAGTHKLGVKAVYRTNETPIVYTTVNIDDSKWAKVDFNVTTNNTTTIDNARIELTDCATNEIYTLTVNNGKVNVPSLPHATYLVGMKVKNFDNYEEQVEVVGDAKVDIALKETIITPYHITAEVSDEEDGTTSALVKWNQVLCFEDGFEDYDDFATGAFGEWRSYDFDQHYVYPIGLGSASNIVTFPGACTPTDLRPIAPIVFNPWNTTPAMLPTDEAVRAPSGDKTIVFFSPQQSGADKWLISPPIKVYDDYVVRFTTKAYAQYKEVLNIGVITTEDVDHITTSNEMTAAFTPLSVIDGVPTGTWTIYETPISSYAGQTVRVAFHYTSYDAFFLQLDEFFAGVPDAEGEAVDVGNVLRYEIYLDGVKVTEASEPMVTLNGLKANATYTVGIVAVYTSGSSLMGEYVLNTTTGIMTPVASPQSKSTKRYDLLGRPVSTHYRGFSFQR